MNNVIILLTLISSLILMGIGMLLYLATRSKTEQNDEINKVFKPISELINNLDTAMDGALEKVGEKISTLNNNYTNSVKTFDEANQINVRLASVLSNNSARGFMGEKIAENLLETLGMIKGVDYKLQEKIGDDIPDIIINLPKEQILCIDVKFPLENYRQMHDAKEKGNKVEAEKYQSNFIKDIKNHIDTVNKRDYTNPDYGCYHRATMFIPNEQILNFIIEQKIKDGNRIYSVLEYANKRNIDFSSPVLFVTHINQIKSLRKDLNQLQNMESIKKAFESVELEFDNFFVGPKGFEKLGEAIDKVHQRFNELNTTRAKKLRKSFESSRELSFNKDTLVKKLSLN